MKFYNPSTLLVLGAISPSLVHSLPSVLVKNVFLETRGNTDFSNLTTNQICGTKQPTPGLREAHAALREDPGVLPRLIGRPEPRPFEKRSLEERQTGRPLVIETFIHWVTTFNQAQYYTQTVRANVVEDQVSQYSPPHVLHAVFSLPLPFFECVARPINPLY